MNASLTEGISAPWQRAGLPRASLLGESPASRVERIQRRSVSLAARKGEPHQTASGAVRDPGAAGVVHRDPDGEAELRAFLAELAPPEDELTLSAEAQNAIGLWIRRADLAGWAGVDVGLVLKRLSEPAVNRPLQHGGVVILCGLFEHLNALVPCVGDVQTSVRADRQADRLVQLAQADPPGAPFAQRGASGIENHDALVTRIRHEDAARSIDDNPSRAPECIGTVGLAKVPEHVTELTVLAEVLNTVIPCVGDVDRAIGCDGDVPWFVKGPSRGLSGREIGKAAPNRDDLAVAGQMLDTVVARVGHEQAAIGCDRQTAGTGELSRLRPLLTDNLVRLEGEHLRGVGILERDRFERGRGYAVLPDCGRHVLSDVQPHLLGWIPVAEFEVVTDQFTVGREVTVEPHVPYCGPVAWRGDGAPDSIPRQAEVILHRPPKTGVVESVKPVPQDRLDFGPVARTGDHQGIALQVGPGVLGEIVSVRVVAQVPPVGVETLVVVPDVDFQPAGRAP